MLVRSRTRTDDGAVIDTLTLCLLGGHIRRCADQSPGNRLCGCRPPVADRHERRGVGQRRDPEVQNLHTSITANHHVRRFQITVNDALLMRGADRVNECDGDSEKLIERQAVGWQEIRQGLTVHPMQGLNGQPSLDIWVSTRAKAER